MTYVLTHFWPDATAEQYQATVAVVHPAEGLPAGQTLHAAGPTEGGYLVTTVWADKASCDAFIAGMQASLPIEGGVVGPPVRREAEITHYVEA